MTQEAYKEILKTAILNEVEAYEFYATIATKFKSPNLTATFMELANEEVSHKKTLEAFLNNESKEMKFNEVQDYKIAEGEKLPRLSSDMSFVDGIKLAMKKEQEAMEMYNKFADLSTDVKQKEVFIQLARMELGHKAKLEQIFTSTAYTEVW